MNEGMLKKAAVDGDVWRDSVTCLGRIAEGVCCVTFLSNWLILSRSVFTVE